MLQVEIPYHILPTNEHAPKCEHFLIVSAF
jgi:hypothetical protein